MDPADVCAGRGYRRVVMVELKLPNIGLPTVAARPAFIAAATHVVAECTVPGSAREHIWVNILNAPDGAWGIAGCHLHRTVARQRRSGVAVRFFVDGIDDAVERALTLGAHRYADEPAVLVDPLGAVSGLPLFPTSSSDSASGFTPRGPAAR